MRSDIYKQNIRNIVRNTIKKNFPGLKVASLNKTATDIASAIHARFYGADVDGVASPIWRDDPHLQDMFKDRHPTKTAQELLNDGSNAISNDVSVSPV